MPGYDALRWRTDVSGWKLGDGFRRWRPSVASAGDFYNGLKKAEYQTRIECRPAMPQDGVYGAALRQTVQLQVLPLRSGAGLEIEQARCIAAEDIVLGPLR